VDLTSLALDGAVVCVELNTAGGIGFLDAPSACDNGEGDADPAAGVIRMDGLTPGSYMLYVIEGPQDLVDGEPREVVVADGELAQLRLGEEMLRPQAVDPGTINVIFQIADGNRVEVEGGSATLDSIGTSTPDNG